MKIPFIERNAAIDDVYRNERIVMVVHHHWFNLLREVVGVGFLFLAPLIGVPVLGLLIGTGPNAAQIGAVVGFLGSLWALICWSFLFVRWTDYYFDVWIITNWRIIDMDLKGLFKVDIGSMLDLDHIQEISTHTDGIIQNLLGFGDILLQTAATKTSTIRMIEVAGPRQIEHVIRSAQVEMHQMKGVDPHL